MFELNFYRIVILILMVIFFGASLLLSKGSFMRRFIVGIGCGVAVGIFGWSIDLITEMELLSTIFSCLICFAFILLIILNLKMSRHTLPDNTD